MQRMHTLTSVAIWVLAVSAALIGGTSTPSYADTIAASPTAAMDNMNPHVDRGRFPLKSSASAVKRNVGPSSTIIGTSTDDPRGGTSSGLSRVPGAPSAGSTGLGGH